MTAKNVKTIAMDYVVQVLKSAARSGVSIPELLVQVGIERERLEDACARVDRATFLRLLLTVMEQTGDEFIGFGQGRRSKPGTFSMMAHAVINCANLEEAVRRGMDFYDDRKSTRLNSSHVSISYAVFCLKKKKIKNTRH